MSIFDQNLSSKLTQEQLHKKIFEKGFQQGYQKATQSAECQLPSILELINSKLAEIDTDKIKTYKSLMKDGAAIGKEVGRALSTHLFKKFPEEEILSLLDCIQDHIQQNAKIRVLVHHSMLDTVKQKLTNMEILSDTSLGESDIHITWNVGGMLTDKKATLQLIEQTIANFIEELEVK